MLTLSQAARSCALFCCLVAAANAQFTQQGPPLSGSDVAGPGQQGFSVALSADGNTALVGGYNDNSLVGAAWVFTRSVGVWSQQGTKLVGSDFIGTSWQGYSVALSADGNTALVGGWGDNNTVGAAWVFTRSNGRWSQQGGKLVGTGAINGSTNSSAQGQSVALSADGNTALIGGPLDNPGGPLGFAEGAVWVFTRSGGVWTQQGSKLFPTADGGTMRGWSVGLSADGNTALVGGSDRTGVPEAWVFTRSNGAWRQEGWLLTGSDANPFPENAGTTFSVALSGDGNTALLGWPRNNNFLGATWVFTRSAGIWSQQGSKLVGSGSIAGSGGKIFQGASVALSTDGNTALVGAPFDNNTWGAAWLFQRSGGVWSQTSKLVGEGPTLPPAQGFGVALSGDGYSALVGAPSYGAFVFTSPKPSTTTLLSSLNPSLYGQIVTFIAAVPAAATGTVTFSIDGVQQSTVPLSGNQAQLKTSSLSPGSHSIAAEYSGDPIFAPSSSNVVTQAVNPLGVISLWANTVVGLGQSTRLPVSLAKPAPPAGLTIYLTSSDPAKVSVTPSVFIPGGRTSPSIQPQVNGLNLGAANIAATSLGYTPDNQSVHVTATLAFARCCVTITGTATQTVPLNLSAPAPGGGLTIHLISDNAKVATVPATVTFPAQATSVNVPIAGVAAGATTIHASALPDLTDVSIKVTVR